MAPPNSTIFTEAEIEKMRLYVTEHDKQKSVNEFDLNNPPRTNYVHQHFPKVVYSLDAEGKSLHKKVQSADDYEAAIAAGWADEPQAPAEPEEIALDEATAAEAAAIDKQAKKKKTAKAN